MKEEDWDELFEIIMKFVLDRTTRDELAKPRGLGKLQGHRARLKEAIRDVLNEPSRP